MRLLREIRDSDIFPDAQDQDPALFEEKQTARAVLLNGLGQVALLHVARYTYHKLPGGGIEDGETPGQARERELLEEMGCRAQITELGTIIEYKNRQRRKQTSFCYLGLQVGEVLLPRFTQSETDHGYSEVWLDSIDAAIGLMEQDQPIGDSRRFIQARELTFLQAAKSLV